MQPGGCRLHTYDELYRLRSRPRTYCLCQSHSHSRETGCAQLLRRASPTEGQGLPHMNVPKNHQPGQRAEDKIGGQVSAETQDCVSRPMDNTLLRLLPSPPATRRARRPRRTRSRRPPAPGHPTPRKTPSTPPVPLIDPARPSVVRALRQPA